MRLYLQKMFSLHGQYIARGNISHLRYVASQSIPIDEQEGNQGTRWKRWRPYETKVLIEAKKIERSRLRSVNAGSGSKSKRTKWEEIEIFCLEKGVERTAQQCKERWDRLVAAYSQIKMWEDVRGTDKNLSFWSLNLDERKSIGFLMNLDQEIYAELKQVLSKRSVANLTSHTSAENNVEQKVESASLSDCNNVANKVGLYSNDNNTEEGRFRSLPAANGSIPERLEDKDEVSIENTAMNLFLEESTATKFTDADSNEFQIGWMRIQNTMQTKELESHTVEQDVQTSWECSLAIDNQSQDIHESKKLFGRSAGNNTSLHNHDNDSIPLHSEVFQGDSAQYEANVSYINCSAGQTSNQLTSLENMSTESNCNNGWPCDESIKDKAMTILHKDGVNQKNSHYSYRQCEPTSGKLATSYSDQTHEHISKALLSEEDANTEDPSKKPCTVATSQLLKVDSLDQCQQHSEVSFTLSQTHPVDDESKLLEDGRSEKDGGKTFCHIFEHNAKKLNPIPDIIRQNSDELGDEQQTTVSRNKTEKSSDTRQSISDKIREAGFNLNCNTDFFQQQHGSNDAITGDNRLPYEVNATSSSERLSETPAFAKYQLSCNQKIISNKESNEVSDEERLSSVLSHNAEHVEKKMDDVNDRTGDKVISRKNELERSYAFDREITERIRGEDGLDMKVGLTVGDLHSSSGRTKEISGNDTLSSSCAAAETKVSMISDKDFDTSKRNECAGKKQRTSDNGLDDIFLYIQSGVFNLTSFVSQAIRKFFKD